MVGTISRKTRPDATLGEMLRTARSQQKITLEQASKTLNISVRQLEALEEGDFSVFSAEIYARGACLKYAQYIGIPKEDVERAIWRALSAARQIVPLRIHTAFSWFERLVSPRSVLLAALGCVVLLIGGYIVWQVKSFWQLPALALQEDVPAVVKDAHLTIYGKSEGQARVKINEEPLILQSDASFTASLTLHPGINVVRIEAENAAGRISLIERHVLLSRSQVAVRE